MYTVTENGIVPVSIYCSPFCAPEVVRGWMNHWVCSGQVGPGDCDGLACIQRTTCHQM